MPDLLHCIELIERHARTLGRDTADRAPELRDAVLYRFLVLGEAASRVSPDCRERHPEIEWAKANRMRNFLIHVYDQIKWEIVWDTAKVDLPKMDAALRTALGMPPKPPDPSSDGAPVRA